MTQFHCPCGALTVKLNAIGIAGVMMAEMSCARNNPKFGCAAKRTIDGDKIKYVWTHDSDEPDAVDDEHDGD